MKPEAMFARSSPKQAQLIEAAFSGDYDMIAALGANRCLAEGTLVATPFGPTPIEQIRVGDYVYDPDGVPIRVLGTFNNGVQDCVAVTHRSNVVAVCTKNHKFLHLKRGKNN